MADKPKEGPVHLISPDSAVHGWLQRRGGRWDDTTRSTVFASAARARLVWKEAKQLGLDVAHLPDPSSRRQRVYNERFTGSITHRRYDVMDAVASRIRSGWPTRRAFRSENVDWQRWLLLVSLAGDGDEESMAIVRKVRAAEDERDGGVFEAHHRKALEGDVKAMHKHLDTFAPEDFRGVPAPAMAPIRVNVQHNEVKMGYEEARSLLAAKPLTLGEVFDETGDEVEYEPSTREPQ